MEISQICHLMAGMQLPVDSRIGRKAGLDKPLLLPVTIIWRLRIHFTAVLLEQQPVLFRCGSKQPIKIGGHWPIGGMK